MCNRYNCRVNKHKPFLTFQIFLFIHFSTVLTYFFGTYSGITKTGGKICVVGDSHIKIIKCNDFNKELRHCKAFFCSFNGANAKQLCHYIISNLIDDKPDAIAIHAYTNDITMKI